MVLGGHKQKMELLTNKDNTSALKILIANEFCQLKTEVKVVIVEKTSAGKWEL